MAEEKEKKDLYTWEDSSESIFKDFEPYHCGTPAITDAFFDFEFDPEKCDETNNFQKFERNGYTNEVTTSKTVDGINYHYSATGQVISGCEKGTVILADHPDHSAVCWKGNSNTTITINSNGTLTIFNNGTEASFDKDSFTYDVFPKRLGILLVGGGGGAGGGTWYDNKKDGTHNDISYYSGGSGGGGGIIWGVIDLEQLCKDKEKVELSIKVGDGGKGGWNASTNGLTHNNPKKGENGKNGGNTELRLSGATVLARANGGKGGEAGHWTDLARGGVGGGSSYNAEYFTYCGKIDGAPGISTKKDMDNAYTQERLNKIQFLQDTTNDERFTYKAKNIPARGSHVTVDTSARIPGGPSFGAGAYDNVKATKGGGGCSNGANGSNNGAKGYWIIFYA